MFFLTFFFFFFTSGWKGLAEVRRGETTQIDFGAEEPRFGAVHDIYYVALRVGKPNLIAAMGEVPV